MWTNTLIILNIFTFAKKFLRQKTQFEIVGSSLRINMQTLCVSYKFADYPLNPFVPNAPFLFSLKTSKNLTF